MKKWMTSLLAVGLVGSFWTTGHAQVATPDGSTPAQEEACDKYKGEGARHGLCVAYCEAQDCDLIKPGTDASCDRIRARFVEASVKSGFALAPKGKEKVIDCKAVKCTAEDRQYCGGQDVDIILDGACTAACTATVISFTDGKPTCQSIGKYEKCVSKE